MERAINDNSSERARGTRLEPKQAIDRVRSVTSSKQLWHLAGRKGETAKQAATSSKRLWHLVGRKEETAMQAATISKQLWHQDVYNPFIEAEITRIDALILLEKVQPVNTTEPL